MEFGDMPPSKPVHDAVTAVVNEFKASIKTWNELQEKDVKSLSEKLTKAGFQVLPQGARL
jgi:hypothetical protein